MYKIVFRFLNTILLIIWSVIFANLFRTFPIAVKYCLYFCLSNKITLVKYKKAMPNLEECLKEYDNWSIPQKNENLKSIIEKITYSKTKRLNWRVDEDDDLELHIDLKL